MAINKKGAYDARATDWDLQVSSNENLDITIEFKVWPTDAAEPDGKSEFEKLEGHGRFFKHLVATEDTFARVVQSLRAMGWTGKDIMALAGRGGDLDGRVCSVEIEEDTYKNQTRLVLSWINEKGQKGVRVGKEMSAEQKAMFAMKFSPDRIEGIDFQNKKDRDERIAAYRAKKATEGNGGGSSAGAASGGGGGVIGAGLPPARSGAAPSNGARAAEKAEMGGQGQGGDDEIPF